MNANPLEIWVEQKADTYEHRNGGLVGACDLLDGSRGSSNWPGRVGGNLQPDNL